MPDTNIFGESRLWTTVAVVAPQDLVPALSALPGYGRDVAILPSDLERVAGLQHRGIRSFTLSQLSAAIDTRAAGRLVLEYLTHVGLNGASIVLIRHVTEGDIDALRRHFASIIAGSSVASNLPYPERVACFALPEHKDRIAAQGHLGWLDDVIFDPAGRRLLTRGRDQTARLWEYQSGREIAVFDGDGYRLRQATFSPAADSIVLVSEGNVIVLNANDLTPRFSIPGSRLFAQYGLDASSIAVTDLAAGETTIRDAFTGEVRAVFPGMAYYSPDRSLMAMASHEMLGDYSQIYDCRSLNRIFNLPGVHPVFSRQGSRLLSINEEDGRSSVFVHDLETQAQVLHRQCDGLLKFAALSPNANRIFATADHGVGFCFAANGTSWQQPIYGDEQGFTPDGRFLYDVGPDLMRLIETNTGHIRFENPGGRIAFGRGCLARSDYSTESWIAGDGFTDVLNLKTFQPEFRVPGRAARFNPARTALVTLLDEGVAAIWDARTGRHRATLGAVRSLLNASPPPRHGGYADLLIGDPETRTMVDPIAAGDRDGGSRRSAEDNGGEGTSDDVPPASVDRYVQADGPAEIQQDEQFEVTVRLTIDPPDPDGGPVAVPLKLPPSIDENGTRTGAPPVTVRIQAPGFVVVDGRDEVTLAWIST
jgi:WD40 repeat protein